MTRLRRLALPEVKQATTTNRNIWILITAVFTFIAGVYASGGNWILFWSMLALWILLGILLAACGPGERRSP
jgi:hypothetical protein